MERDEGGDAMRKNRQKESGQTGKEAPLPAPTETDGLLSLRHFFFAANAPLLELLISLPLPTGNERGARRIAAFYRRLAEEAVSCTAEELVPALRAAYEADGDPRKRFRHRPARLTLRGRVSEESGAYFSVVRESRLQHGKGETVRRAAEIFSAKSGRLYPPAYLGYKGVPLAPPRPSDAGVTPEKGRKKPPKNGKGGRKKAAKRGQSTGYFLENGELHPVLDDVRIF